MNVNTPQSETKKVYLDDEFEKFWNMLDNNENFALLRYGDGERAIMEGRQVLAQEGWHSPDYIGSLGKALLETIEYDSDKLFKGISCPCCDQSAFHWYSSRIKNKKSITFANVFVNGNYHKFKNRFSSLKRDAVFIGNYRSVDKKIGSLNILKYYTVSDDCFSFWDENARSMLEKIKQEFGRRSDLLYVVSAGPMSEPIIVDLLKHNPNNCYIDFGSSIDEFTHEVKTRPYMLLESPYSKLRCWMYNLQRVDFDVSVVMNLYRRPETLEMQLNAIENQTHKPKEILLYQDGTGDTFKISESIKKRFNIIEISPVNRGVWERFRFAKKASSSYVCIFDDDTIPGKSWLENCWEQMQEQEGLYGTIGIVLNEPEFYPYGDYIRIGWDNNNTSRCQVDFVGHSWFFKREWINYIFIDTEEMQALKVAGEDIAFSFKLQKHGIKTFVPPHPPSMKELWGATPELAFKYGVADVAISSESKNLDLFNKAIRLAISGGFYTVSSERKGYYDKLSIKMGLKSYLEILFKKIYSKRSYKIDNVKYRIYNIFNVKIKTKKVVADRKF